MPKRATYICIPPSPLGFGNRCQSCKSLQLAVGYKSKRAGCNWENPDSQRVRKNLTRTLRKFVNLRMNQKAWRARYMHVPRDFARRVRVLQETWDLNAVDFGWRLGLNFSYVHRFRQGTAMPSLALVSRMEHAAGIQTVNYLMACPASRCPKEPKENTGVKGPGRFERMWLKRKKKQRLVMLPSGVLGYEP